jgi:hypothetical protein
VTNAEQEFERELGIFRTEAEWAAQLFYTVIKGSCFRRDAPGS